MTVGSLFSGIGGFDLGFERAGFEIKWQVEIDPFCRAVLAKHWPGVRRYEDVRTVGMAGVGAELERVDVLCGGFPCQDISVAGKGVGIDGERSGLWSEFDRLIGELRPRYVVVENVSALLVRGFERVLGDLATRRYDAEWDCLPASAFGAPHQRDRVWLVAYPWGTRRHERRAVRPRAGGSLLESSRSGEDVADAASGIRQRAPSRQAGHVAFSSEDVSDADRAGQCEQRRIFPIRTEFATAECRRWWGTEPNVGRVAHGIPARVDRLRGLGNAIVPQIAEWIAKRIIDAEAFEGEGHDRPTAEQPINAAGQRSDTPISPCASPDLDLNFASPPQPEPGP